MTRELPVLVTERLVVRLAGDEDVAAIVEFLLSNRDFLRPFEPARADTFFEPDFWTVQLRQNVVDHESGRALRMFLFPIAAPGVVIGSLNFTRIERGASHSCALGYSLARDAQGRGYMFEALTAGVDHIFHSRGLHRIEAAYMPHNRRSGALLRRLGFTVEGYARDYLQIDGRWEDHILASLTHPHWR